MAYGVSNGPMTSRDPERSNSWVVTPIHSEHISKTAGDAI